MTRTNQRPNPSTTTSKTSSPPLDLRLKSSYRSASPFMVRGVLLFALAVTLDWHTPTVVAQSPPVETPVRAPLSRFVPASAGVFVQVRDATALEAALRKNGAQSLFPILLGLDEKTPPSDLRSLLTGMVSAQHPELVDALMRHELGVMSGSWGQLSSGVILARLPSDGALSEWLPAAQRQDAPGPVRDMLFRTKGGMMVGQREGVAAFAQRRGGSEVLRDALRLIIGGDGETLDAAPGFRELSAALPAKPLAVAHLSATPKHPDALSWFGWKDLRRAVLGLYGREDRLDVAVRGHLSKPAPRKSLGTAALERFYKLPATTLAAWISSADLRLTYDQLLRESSESVAGRYLSLIETLRSVTGRDANTAAALGPHIIFVWDEPLDGPSTAPQLAMLIESAQAQSVVDELDEIAGSWLPDTLDDPDAARVSSTDYLGTRVRHVPLFPLVADESLPLAGTLAQLELSWTAQGDWVILALGREHLHRLLDAQSGLIPTLSNLSDVQGLRRRGNPTSLLLAQPDLAADVIQRWLDRASAEPDAWFGEEWWRRTLAGEGSPAQRLGVAARVEQIPGVVVVAHAHPDTPAFGRLEPEDWILAVDGQVLDLQSPNADLRRLWSTPTTNGRHTLRILRGDLVQDVVLTVPSNDGGWSQLLTRPADVLRDLATAVRPIRFASWTVHASEADQYSALISLRFANAESK